MPADTSKFEAMLEKQEKLRLIASAEAIDVFGEHVLGDAQQLCPKLTGALAASATNVPAEISGGKVSKLIGFNTSYAAAVHENLKAKHSNGEAKFLETAVKENQGKMAGFVGEYVEQKLGGADGSK